MVGTSLAHRVLHDQRLLPACGLLLAVVASWAYLWSGAGTMTDMGGMSMPMSSGPWTPQHGLVMLGMWVTMMAAMMLPSATPMILLFAGIARGRRARGEHAAPPAWFALGYLAVWALFSLLAVALQFLLEKTALLSPMMETTSTALAAGVLLAAGAYQWTPLKLACLRRCRSPLDFLLQHWREGRAGALRMGLLHGVYCVGCCWALMLVLFVGGLMNMGWIVALTALVLLEKLAPGGHWMGRLAGLAFIAWGLVLLPGVLR